MFSFINFIPIENKPFKRNIMSDEIQYTVEWAIKPGSLAAFKEMAESITKMVEENEPQMKGYQWYFNADGTKGYTLEWHTSSDSLLAHLQNVGDVLPNLMAHCDLSRFDVFGNPSQEAKNALNTLGAKYFNYYAGFTR